MLTVEQAKPGVEVICTSVSNSYPFRATNLELLRVGHVYSIQRCFKNPYSIFPEHTHLINLNEIQTIDSLQESCAFGHQYYYGLHRFKLLDRKDIQIFYDLIERTADKKVIEPA